MPTPRKFETNMTEIVMIRMTPNIKAYVEYIAEQTGRGTADVFRDLVLTYGDQLLKTEGITPPADPQFSPLEVEIHDPEARRDADKDSPDS